MRRLFYVLFLVVSWLASMAAARAAGGHFDVDDAAVLQPGRCQYEVWVTRTLVASTTLLHGGSACRVGPVELGLSDDRVSTATDMHNLFGSQLKWAANTLDGKLGVGLVWIVGRDLTAGGRPAHTLFVPFTWAAAETLAFNVNLGADRDPDHVRTRRLGLSGEWIAHKQLTVVAERLTYGGAWTSRLGARWSVGGATSVDLSAARIGAAATHGYSIGLNHEFAR